MLKSKGIIEVSPDRVTLIVSEDFARYYRQLIYWQFPNLIGGLSLPRHGTHITVCRSKHYVIDKDKARKWTGCPVEFYYDPFITIGGRNFVGFYMNIESRLLDLIKNDIVIETLSPSNFHLSLCNTKHQSHEMAQKY